MEKSVLSAGGDPMGAAIYDFHRNGSADVLKVYSSDFDDDEIPVADLFREYEEMPYIERVAIDMADGKVLDVGQDMMIIGIWLLEMLVFIRMYG